MIMMHGDDDGMIMPPRIAPVQIVILPVVKEETRDTVMEACDKLAKQLREKGFAVKLDDRDLRTPDKMWDAVKRGIPVRVEIGAREVENDELTFVRRDIGRESKKTVKTAEFVETAQSVLDDIHETLLNRTRKFRDENTVEGKGIEDIRSHFESGKIGFVKVPIETLDDPDMEALMTEHSLSTRNMPFEDEGRTVLIAKAY
jgi:prolyl-tRNA synthetase